jgi:hypothetical protein
MALSLAACGGSSDTAVAVVEEPAATTPVVEEPVVVEPVVEEPVVVEPVVTALTAGADTTGTDGNDSFTAATGTLTADNTIVGTDDIAGGAGDDTIAISLGANFGGFTTTGTDTGSMTGVEVVELSAADAIARSFDATGVSGVVTYKVDGTNATVSIADSADLSALDLSNIASGAFSITYTAPTGGTSPVAGTADTLNLAVQGLGSATADIAITAAGVETVAITSNAAATAALATNYLGLSGLTNATTITVTGAASLDLGNVSTATTSLDASGNTGSITAALGNAAAGALTSIKTGTGDDAVTAAYGDLTANATISMGAGADTLTLTGATGAAVSQFVMSGVETLNVSSITGAATTVSLAKAGDVPSTIIAGTSKAGANVNYAGDLDFVGDSGAKNIDYIGATTGTITTDSTGAVDIDVTANAAATSTALNANSGRVEAASAGSLDVSVTGNANYTGVVQAAKATSAIYTVAGGAQTGAQIAAAKAEAVTITADKNVVLAAATDFSGAKTVTIASSGAFRDSSTNGFDAAATLNLSGTGSKAAATFDTLVGATDLAYSQTVTATGLKAGLTFTGGVDAGSGSLTVNNTGVTGAINMGAMDAGGTVTYTASSLGANTLGLITAGAVVINASDALGGVAYTGGNDIVATTSATIDGPTVSATDVDITASATSTALTVDVDGSIVADAIDVTGGVKSTNITVKGDAGVGVDAYSVTLVDTTTATSTVTVDVSGVVADTTNQSTISINVAAENDNDMVITGSKGTSDTLALGTAKTYTGDMTISGIETITHAVATVTAASVNGVTATLTAATTTDNFTMTGTTDADTINVSKITHNGALAADFIINAGTGADVITGSAEADTIDLGADTAADSVAFLASTDAANGKDVITSHKTADVYDFSLVLTSGTIENTATGTALGLDTQAALAAEGTSIAVAANQVFLAEIDTSADVDTVAELVTALTNTGKMDAVDVAASSEAIIIVGGADVDTTHFIYGINNDATAAIIAGEVALLATVTTNVTAGMDGLITTNFDFA